MNWREIVEKYDLDVSEVNFDELIGRIDAEYYRTEYLENEYVLDALSTEELKTLCNIKSGTTPKDRDDALLDGVILLKTTDIRNKPLSRNSNYYHISDKINQRMKSTELQIGDVLINIVGATLEVIGRVSIVPNNFPRANITQAMALIRTSNKTNLLSGYIFAFLLSRYGNLQIKRLARPTGQYNLNLQEVSAIRIVKANLILQTEIEKIINEYLLITSQSENLYSQAEALLLSELGLADYIPNEANTSIRDLFECLADDRFDAEYWMPKYDEIIAIVKCYKNSFSTIGQEFAQLKNNFKRQDDKEYNYIEIGDVNVSTSEVDYNTFIGKELPANAKVKFGKRQLITSKVRPNRGATAILSNHEGFIGSGAFTVLTESGSVNLETLMVYLKTQSIRELLLRYNTGTSYPVIIDNDILQLPIPLIEKSIQDKIAEYISTASKASKQSKHLLEKAKRAVEIFIEQDEEKALEYLSI